jgi:hypothetical protein
MMRGEYIHYFRPESSREKRRTWIGKLIKLKNMVSSLEGTVQQFWRGFRAIIAILMDVLLK